MELSVQYGKTKIDYTLIRSNRKTLAIEVHPDLVVKVVAPFDVSVDSIKEKVIKRTIFTKEKKRGEMDGLIMFNLFVLSTSRGQLWQVLTRISLSRRVLMRLHCRNHQ